MFEKIFNWLKTVVQFLKLITQYRVMIPKEPGPPEMTYLYKLLCNKKIHDPEFRTLLILHFLAARYPDYRLPPLQVASLAALRKVSARTIEFHLARLQRLALIRVTPLADAERELVILGEKIFMPAVLELVVVNKDMVSSLNDSINNTNLLEEQQLQVLAVPDEEICDLQRQMAEIFSQDGRSANKALKYAASLIALNGYQVCVEQLSYLERRCELFSQNGGLRTNRSAVLIASIKTNWSPPPALSAPQGKAWYTPDEFNQLIEH
jgi:hypothetical protein